MKTLVMILMAGAVCSCSRTQPASEPYPDYLIKDEDWIVYEGTLPVTNSGDTHVELSLYPGAPGLDSRYRMMEYPDTPSTTGYRGWIGSRGTYVVLSSPEARIIHITDRSVFKAFLQGENFPRPDFGKQDLYLKSDGDNRLMFVDEDFRETSDHYVLTRRSSPLFTVEGYFSVYNDTTDFFEKNTQKQWSVAQLGAYDEAVRKYTYLSKEKFEGVYLKALAYTVRHLPKDGEEIDALVFKKILEMDSTTNLFK